MHWVKLRSFPLRYCDTLTHTHHRQLHTWARLSFPTKTVVCLLRPCPVHKTRWCSVRKKLFHTLLKPVCFVGFFSLLSSVAFGLYTPVVFSQLLVKHNDIFSPPYLQFWLLIEAGWCFERTKKRQTTVFSKQYCFSQRAAPASKIRALLGWRDQTHLSTGVCLVWLPLGTRS